MNLATYCIFGTFFFFFFFELQICQSVHAGIQIMRIISKKNNQKVYPNGFNVKIIITIQGKKSEKK